MKLEQLWKSSQNRENVYLEGRHSQKFRAFGGRRDDVDETENYKLHLYQKLKCHLNMQLKTMII